MFLWYSSGVHCMWWYLLMMCRSRTSRFKEPALVSERWEPAHVRLTFRFRNVVPVGAVGAAGVTCMLCNQSCEDWQGSYHQTARGGGSSAETVTGRGGGRDTLKERESEDEREVWSAKMSDNRKRSSILMHFDSCDNMKAQCRICKVKLILFIYYYYTKNILVLF